LGELSRRAVCFIQQFSRLVGEKACGIQAVSYHAAMNTNKRFVVLGLVCGMALAAAMQAGAQNALCFGGRYHQDHSVFTKLPYGEGDLSYGVLYEAIEKDTSVLQLGCSMTPEFDKNPDIDYAVTPELNLLMQDRIFQGGVGIMSSYLSKHVAASEWMDLYWQLLLGVRLELSKSLTLQVNGSYVFESWGDLGDFDMGDVEGVAYIGFSF